ncbi:MAG: glutamine amidotransferase-related protein [Patescibacteria group bacterium]
MKILIIDNISKYLDKLKTLLGNQNEFEVLKFNEVTLDILEKNYDLIILSGGKPARLGLHEKEKNRLNELQQEIILKTNIPLIGICYGFRMIAEAYDSKLVYEEAIIKGIKQVKLISNFWKDKVDTNIPCHEEHHYTCKRLSPELIPLATSSRGIEIIKHKKKKIFGLQFHPEVNTDNQYGDEIFRYILNKIM